MQTRSPKNHFAIVCISAAIGLLLYWAMFMNAMPRLIRPEGLDVLPALSGTIGAASSALFLLGAGDLVSSLRRRRSHAITLMREASGKVVSIGPQGSGASRSPTHKPGMNLASDIAGIACLVLLALSLYASASQSIVVIGSKSMSPALNVGDIAVLHRPKTIQVGDIIAFRTPEAYAETGAPTIHRVAAVEDGLYRTRGDANPDEDPWLVEAGDVVGVCAWRAPLVGFLILFMRTPVGIITVAAATALSFLYPRRGAKR